MRVLLMSFTFYLVSFSLSRALYKCILLKKTTLKHCVCAHFYWHGSYLYNIPSTFKLPELSSVTLVYRELFLLTPTEALPQKAKRKEWIAGALKSYKMKTTMLCVHENWGHFFLCWVWIFLFVCLFDYEVSPNLPNWL